jgi:hypothetical protein
MCIHKNDISYEIIVGWVEHLMKWLKAKSTSLFYVHNWPQLLYTSKKTNIQIYIFNLWYMLKASQVLLIKSSILLITFKNFAKNLRICAVIDPITMYPKKVAIINVP